MANELNDAFLRLGFNADAARMLADANRENLDMQTLHCFDDKGVKILCATLRKPGGLVPGVAPAGGGPKYQCTQILVCMSLPRPK